MLITLAKNLAAFTFIMLFVIAAGAFVSGLISGASNGYSAASAPNQPAPAPASVR